MSKLDFLQYKRIRELRVKPGEDALAFVTPDGTFALETEADCCSETWFADIINPQALFRGWGGIRKVEEFELPEPTDGRSRQEYDHLMGLRLTTASGVCEILYRNSSNGYYGGNIGRVYVPESVADWVLVTSDWQAPGS